MVKALVLTGYGLNCDCETAHALKQVGAEAHRIHVNSLLWGEENLDDYHIFVFDGGFSYGDDHGAGVILAMKIRYRLGEAFEKFIEAGKLVLGICNGFQVLVNMGLLPGLVENPRKRQVALTCNDCGNFRDQWVHLAVNDKSPCVFTKDIHHLELPIRHGEGKFYAAGEIVSTLFERNQVVIQYATEDFEIANGTFPENPNGSFADIAGICDATGKVFGLMPHPEAFAHWSNHPDWTRKMRVKGTSGDFMKKESPGLLIFRNAVEYCRNTLM